MADFIPLGELSKDIIDKFKRRRLAILVRGSEVFIDNAELAEAKTIIKEEQDKNPPKDKRVVVNSFGFKVPYNLTITKRGPEGYPANPRAPKANMVHLSLFAKPTNGPDNNANTERVKSLTVYGKKLEWSGYGRGEGRAIFTPSYRGVILTDDNGIPLYEILPSNVFVLFHTEDLTKEKDTREIHGWKQSNPMLSMAVKLANHVDNPAMKQIFDKLFDDQSPMRQELEVRQFEEMCQGAVRTEERNLRRSVDNIANEIQSLQANLYGKLTAHGEAINRLDYIEKNLNASIRKKAREEWAALQRFKENGTVTTVTVNANSFSFTTRTISWKPPRRQGSRSVEQFGKEPIELGEYQITIGLENWSVDIVNITRQVAYGGTRWHHPHIRANNRGYGGICMGNLTAGLPEFARNRDFAAIIMSIIRWLENVDTGDVWGRHLADWKIDQDKRKRKENKKTGKVPQNA